MNLCHLKNLICEEVHRILDEAMFQEPPEGYVVQVEGDLSEVQLIIEKNDEGSLQTLGSLLMHRIETNFGNFWELENVEAEKGFGPLLYDIAMELASNSEYFGDYGLIPDRTSVSKSAQRVWKHYFLERTDVQHEKLPEEWLVANGLSKRDLWLHQYYYKKSTPILDRLNQDNKIESDDFTFF